MNVLQLLNYVGDCHTVLLHSTGLESEVMMFYILLKLKSLNFRLLLRRKCGCICYFLSLTKIPDRPNLMEG